jgi:phospholipid/cholesterol/gamma-HCH transport system ATP-binding protein
MMPAELSRGMMKRASLARALALDPPIVFFDEPSAGLDPITSAGIDALVLTLRKLLGTTFIIVSHELKSICTTADRILMLDAGKALFLGSIAEAHESSIPRLRQFFERRSDPSIKEVGA